MPECPNETTAIPKRHVRNPPPFRRRKKTDLKDVYKRQEFIRGILATTDVGVIQSALKRRVVKKMSLNYLIKPDFISYDYNGYPLPERKVRKKACLAWTVTSYEIWDKIKPYVDNIIFEGFSID